MGSRGSKTYSPNAAKPIERSITPAPAVPPVYSAPTPQAASPGMPSAPVRQGFFERHPFLGGLMGGLVGAGIGSLLFGGHFFGGGLGGVISLLLQIALIVFLVRLAIGFFRRQAQPETVPSAAIPSLSQHGGAVPASGPASMPAIELSAGDLSIFEGRLADIQMAWSSGDASSLYRLATPELAGYMDEQLRGNAGKGLRNRVEQVRLLKGDVLETWREGTVDYATVRLRWSAVDYTVRAGGGEIVSGDPGHPSESTEVWTFVRHLNGPWLLSAIQQV